MGSREESLQYHEQKAMEKRILEAARLMCPLIPNGEIETRPEPEPDLRIKTPDGWLYVEVTELIRSAERGQTLPVIVESFHHDIMQLAEQYHRDMGAAPVNVFVYFSDKRRGRMRDPEGWRSLTADNKAGNLAKKMARSLAEFVSDSYDPALGHMSFQRNLPFTKTVPTGFDTVLLSPHLRDVPWHSAEYGRMPILTRDQLADRIKAKSKLLPKYRMSSFGAPVWLLIASGVTVSKCVPAPSDVEQWVIESDFDKILLFSGWNNHVFELDSGTDAPSRGPYLP